MDDLIGGRNSLLFFQNAGQKLREGVT